MRILFDSIFESAVLFPSEKEFYQRKGILTIMTDSRSRPCSRPCDMFGGMHLLRFLVALSVVSRGAGKGSDRTGRKRAGAPAAASASYLTSDAAFSGIEDVLTELDNTFPLAEDY